MQSILGGEHEAHFVEPPLEMDDSENFPTVGLDANAPSGPNSDPEIRKILGRRPMRFRDRSERPDTSTSTSLSSRPEHSPIDSPLPSGVYELKSQDAGSTRGGGSFAGTDGAGHHSNSASPHLGLSRASSTTDKRSLEGTRGHARDPLEEDYPFLFIGPSTYTGIAPPDSSVPNSNIGGNQIPIFAEPENTEDSVPMGGLEGPVQMVSESPGAADFDIYETAYRQELERINTNLTASDAGARVGAGPKVYLTRRVEGKPEVMDFVKDKDLDLQIITRQPFGPAAIKGSSVFGAAVSMLRGQLEQKKHANLGGQQQPPDGPIAQCTGSHLPSLSLSSQPNLNPEVSPLVVTASEPRAGQGDSETKLRRLLDHVGEDCPK